jgi:hypothetical protein
MDDQRRQVEHLVSQTAAITPELEVALNSNPVPRRCYQGEAEREADGYTVVVQGSRRAMSVGQGEQKR